MGTAAFAVTTRSRLRGIHLFPPMFVASLRIRRQLARTPGCVRFASVIASPREFWTITVWESRDKMLDFMRSGAHDDIMWLFAKWLRSFWLMRWRPTSEERGNWSGTCLGAPLQLPPPPRPKSEQARAALAAALDALPRLKSSVGADGAPRYDTAASTRRHLRAVSGAAAIMARLETEHVWQIPAAWRDMRRLQRRLQGSPTVLRQVMGIARPRELYALAVLRDDRACSELLSQPEQRELKARWGDRFWTMRWQPANEFGHWDGLRLRRERLGTAIRVPRDAARAARTRAEQRQS